jgi:hypothetical protein
MPGRYAEVPEMFEVFPLGPYTARVKIETPESFFLAERPT